LREEKTPRKKIASDAINLEISNHSVNSSRAIQESCSHPREAAFQSPPILGAIE
jgi:hypothetical protein